ncbi:WD40/YVTN/BNR-like repeat-containing protein [Halomarina litorea]|uniref:WD40/YVTN/BNR-like repeat-containing protein n=1 Tax=Halomarina litorea TaxID=2961595 RepID=UPI0020C40FF9|nr:glycosyl hydrolase [Halomarina sp. BCD28]
MRLHGLYDGRLYGSDYQTLYAETRPGRFAATGRLTNPMCGRDYLRSQALTARFPKRLVEYTVGAFPTTNVWALPGDAVLATLDRWLLLSRDGGASWRPVRELPRSSGPMGVLPTALCRDGDRLLLGEYPLGDEVPNVLESTDGGRSWSTLLALPEVRHVHAIQADPYSGDVWVTTGDADEECRIARLREGSGEVELDVVGTGSQRWRAVELAFTPEAVLWGMDCTYAEDNHLLRVARDELDDDPDPEVVGTASGSVFYSATWGHDGTQWIAFSTALETGLDSTSPTDRRVNRTTSADVLVSSSDVDFERWETLASYGKRRALADYTGGRLPTASTYVFLAASDDRGLFVNPYNTDRHDGKVRQYRPEVLAGLAL